MPSGASALGPSNGIPIVSVGRVGGEERPEQRDAEHEDEQGEPDRARGDPQEPHAVEHRGRHRVVLSFGTSSTTSRSAIRLMRR